MQFRLNVLVQTTVTSVIDNVNVMYGSGATSIVLCYADGALSDVQWYSAKGTSVVPTMAMFDAVKEYAHSIAHLAPNHGALTLSM